MLLLVVGAGEEEPFSSGFGSAASSAGGLGSSSISVDMVAVGGGGLMGLLG